MNLNKETWIPIRRKSGHQEKIAPWLLTDLHKTDPIVALDTPRADFNGALAQFLIGLLQTAAAPGESTQIDWLQWLSEPPAPERLSALFAPYAEYFELGGEGPRFLQDFEPLSDTPKPIAALLIETPGANTLKQNADHFIKRGGVDGLCPACAATALFTLQTNAPSGGAGHRTSLRGGGPLSTLVILDPKAEELEATLWRDLWLNVLPQDRVRQLTGNLKLTEPQAIFPWLGPARTSAKGEQDTLPEHAHPLQMYWGMPRRIRLDLENTIEGECDICASKSMTLITQFVTKNYGVNYSGAWEHPLSPHYLDEKTGAPMPSHAQPGGFSYRHWSAWVAKSDARMPARVVTHFDAGKLSDSQLRVWAFGYDMDNMKARAWYETTVPLYLMPSGSQRVRFIRQVDNLIDAAVQTAIYLQGAVKEAWFRRPGDVRGDTRFLREAFFDRTEGDFYALLREIHKTATEEVDDTALRERWLGVLRKQAETLFQARAESGPQNEGDLARIARAHNDLRKRLWGNKLYTLLDLKKPKKQTEKDKGVAA
ncbi:MAG: type I-E CRISPR-associated protein Cse1/CasA [Candidatus Thiodiazotropha sp. (ex Lucinoma borealis)]|nr:type I-E CRISPR-associated protein Cse1/CasA [Candidatus Thiodiazotropha sp. (ex Lucinoma borealis)]